MKRPNPIFLGVITLVALLPHAPRLLPGPTADLRSELQSTNVKAVAFDEAQTELLELPTAELPPVRGSDCTDASPERPGYENKSSQRESESNETRPAFPSIDTTENCDAAGNPSLQNALSLHLVSARL